MISEFGDNQLLLDKPDLFDSAWRIMVESFPENERNEREGYLLQLKNPLFSIKLYNDGQNSIKAFVGYWILRDYIFVEHFAVSALYRNQGLGNTIFKDLLNNAPKPLVLEVEPPTDDLSARRINFYERLGFTLNHFPYLQPAYRTGGERVNLLLMSSNGAINPEGFELLRDEIYNTVYGNYWLRD